MFVFVLVKLFFASVVNELFYCILQMRQLTKIPMMCIGMQKDLVHTGMIL